MRDNILTERVDMFMQNDTVYVIAVLWTVPSCK